MVTQSELLELMQHTADPQLKRTLLMLHDMWIKVGNDSVNMSPEHLVKVIAAIEEMLTSTVH